MRNISLVRSRWILFTLVTLSAACSGAGGASGGSSGSSSGSEDGWRLNETRSTVAGPAIAEAAQSTSGDFRIQVPLGVDRAQIALGAAARLTVGKGAKVTEIGGEQFGMASAGAAVELGDGSVIGNVYSVGGDPVVLAENSAVHGFVRTAATVLKAPSATIELGTMEHADRQMDEFRWSVKFPQTKSPDKTAAAVGGMPLDLVAGPYGQVVVEPGATLVLHAGAYYFDSFDVRPNAIVEIENSYGPVYLWVRNSLGMSGIMVLYSETPNVLFGYAGTTAPRIESAFHGTLVAPWADISLPAVAQKHVGAFFGHSISVADGAMVEHQSFQPGDADYAAAPDYDMGCWSCWQQPNPSAMAACSAQYNAATNACTSGAAVCQTKGLALCTFLIADPPAYLVCAAANIAACTYQQNTCYDTANTGMVSCTTNILINTCVQVPCA